MVAPPEAESKSVASATSTGRPAAGGGGGHRPTRRPLFVPAGGGLPPQLTAHSPRRIDSAAAPPRLAGRGGGPRLSRKRAGSLAAALSRDEEDLHRHEEVLHTGR
jgi:hypothetical protein